MASLVCFEEISGITVRDLPRRVAPHRTGFDRLNNMAVDCLIVRYMLGRYQVRRLNQTANMMALSIVIVLVVFLIVWGFRAIASMF